jgi:hypothetical protein
MYWSTGSGRIELNITKTIAANCSHSGSCDVDVKEAMQINAIKRQLNKLNPNLLANELREYGAWDEEELSDHEANKMRILWIACGDISDRNI